MKQKNQYFLLGGMVLFAAVIWYFNRNTPLAPDGIVATLQDVPLLTVENPQLRFKEIERVRKTEYKSSGRNIFSAVAPPSVASVAAARKVTIVPVIPQTIPTVTVPPVPPLPVKFFGYGTVPNGTARLAFFTDGEAVYIVGEGAVLLNRFRIIKIHNASLDYEEVASGRRGTAILEEQAAGPSA